MTQGGNDASAPWIVAPNGRRGAGVAGTRDDPWSFAYAGTGAHGRIQPGDTVWLRAGTYRSVNGFTIGFSGTRDRAVTWRAAPNERFELDGAIPEFVDTPATAWEPVSIEPGHNLYRSTSVYPKARLYGGFIEIDGCWLPLAPHKNRDASKRFTLNWISSDHHNWRHPKPYYLGPGICNDPKAEGHLFVRLDDSTPEAQCRRTVAQIADPDPRHHALRISGADRFGIILKGNHHVFEGFTEINNYYGAFRLLDETGITFRRVGGRVVFFGARLGRASHVRIEDPSFNGCMDPERWWISLIDIKGTQTAKLVRKCGLDYGAAHHVEVTGGFFHDFFDGGLSQSAHDVEIHGVEFRCWDDAWQMAGSLYRIDQHHNLYVGAGPSRDGTATDRPNPDPGTLWIHDNVVDTSRYRIFYYRFGRFKEDPTGIGWREPIAFSGHDSTGDRTIPWKLYQNTIVRGIGRNAPPPSDFVGIGQFGNDQAIVEAPHEAYNNVILVRDGRPLARDTWVDTGAEIYDGNVYWGWSNPSSSGFTSIWRRLHRSAGLVNGEAPKGSIGDVDKLRELARADSQVYYPPGWEASGLFVDPHLDADYKPRNMAVASGAVDLTGTGWPGTSLYKPWRGAIHP